MALTSSPVNAAKASRRGRRQTCRGSGANWGDTRLKVHLGRLAELEYLLAHRVRAAQGLEYELLHAGEGAAGERFVLGLSGGAGHAYDARRSGSKAERSGTEPSRSAPGRPSVGGRSGGDRPGKTTANPSPEKACGGNEENPPEAHVTPALKQLGVVPASPVVSQRRRSGLTRAEEARQGNAEGAQSPQGHLSPPGWPGRVRPGEPVGLCRPLHPLAGGEGLLPPHDRQPRAKPAGERGLVQPQEITKSILER